MLVEKLFCSFVNPLISLCIYYDRYEKILRKKTKQFFKQFVSMEISAIFDFRALTEVRITLKLKPVLKMQCKVAHT